MFPRRTKGGKRKGGKLTQGRASGANFMEFHYEKLVRYFEEVKKLEGEEEVEGEEEDVTFLGLFFGGNTKLLETFQFEVEMMEINAFRGGIFFNYNFNNVLKKLIEEAEEKEYEEWKRLPLDQIRCDLLLRKRYLWSVLDCVDHILCIITENRDVEEFIEGLEISFSGSGSDDWMEGRLHFFVKDWMDWSQRLEQFNQAHGVRLQDMSYKVWLEYQQRQIAVKMKWVKQIWSSFRRRLKEGIKEDSKEWKEVMSELLHKFVEVEKKNGVSYNSDTIALMEQVNFELGQKMEGVKDRTLENMSQIVMEEYKSLKSQQYDFEPPSCSEKGRFLISEKRRKSVQKFFVERLARRTRDGMFDMGVKLVLSLLPSTNEESFLQGFAGNMSKFGLKFSKFFGVRPGFAKFGFCHAHVQFVNLGIHWFSNSLVCLTDMKEDKSMYDEIIAVEAGCPNIAWNLKSAYAIVLQLAEYLVTANVEQHYEYFSFQKDDSKINCQEFSQALLRRFDSTEFEPEVQGYLEEFVKEYSKFGSTKPKDTFDSRWLPLKKDFIRRYRRILKKYKKLGNRDTNLQRVYFNTRKEVCDFTTDLLREDENFSVLFPGTYQLLKGFDRAFLIKGEIVEYNPFDFGGEMMIMRKMESTVLEYVQKSIVDLGQKVYLLEQMTKVVDSLHCMKPKPFLHRDIKAENFLVSAGGDDVKICDFGLATTKPETTKPLHRKIQDAPEVLKGQFTEKSDIYSLGIAFWEVLFEKRPSNDLDFSKTSFCDEGGEELPELLKKLLRWCCEEDGEKRPTTTELLCWFESEKLEFGEVFGDRFFPTKNFQKILIEMEKSLTEDEEEEENLVSHLDEDDLGEELRVARELITAREEELRRRKRALEILEKDFLKRVFEKPDVKKRAKLVEKGVREVEREMKKAAKDWEKRKRKLEKKELKCNAPEKEVLKLEPKKDEGTEETKMENLVNIEVNFDEVAGMGELEFPYTMTDVVREFMEIDDRPQPDRQHFKIAMSAKNKFKNRYRNILPYDHNVVITRSGYLNASDFRLNNIPYLACQWPLKRCEVDFWSTVYNYKVKVIVNLQEPKKRKNLQYYWPHVYNQQKEMKFGYCVNTVDIVKGEVFEIYHCKVEKKFSKISSITRKFTELAFAPISLHEEEKKHQDVYILVYKRWPDLGIPDEYSSLLELIKKTDLLNLEGVSEYSKEPPILVHCSAGIGRTGVFVLAHNILRNGWDTKKIKETLIQMRAQRNGMIQTAAQYRFAYDFVWKYTEYQKKK